MFSRFLVDANGFKPMSPAYKAGALIRLSYASRAEMNGFEPLVESSPHTRLAGECLKPDSATSLYFLAEWRGFEPLWLSHQMLFKNIVISHTLPPFRVVSPERFERSQATLEEWCSIQAELWGVFIYFFPNTPHTID